MVANSPDGGSPMAFTGRMLRSVAVASSDYAEQPLGIHPKLMGRAIITYADPRVVSILSPWRVKPALPALPAWAVGSGEDSPVASVEAPEEVAE